MMADRKFAFKNTVENGSPMQKISPVESTMSHQQTINTLQKISEDTWQSDSFGLQFTEVHLLFIIINYFNCISFAIRLSGRKVAIKLIDWLIDLIRVRVLWPRVYEYKYQ